MNHIIWKLNPSNKLNFNFEFDIDIDQTYFCVYCCKHVQNEKFKSLLIPEPDPNFILKQKLNECKTSYTNPIIYTKCFICQRYIKGILNGPDIINFIENSINDSECENNLLILISRFKIWYYHGIYDYFGMILKNKFSMSKNFIKNIYQVINELNGLPQIDIINQRAEYIINLIL